MLQNFPQPAKILKVSFDLLRPVKALINESRKRSNIAECDETTFGMDYVDRVLERYNVSYYSSQHSRVNIPANGRVIIFVNHAISSLEGLALLRFVNEVRQDVKLVSMDLLTGSVQLGERIVQVSRGDLVRQRRGIQKILACLKQEQALIVFPAVKLSASYKLPTHYTRWSQRFLKLAYYSNAPLLPVFLESRTIKRARFGKRSDKVSAINGRCDMFIKVGEIIPAREIKSCGDSLHKKGKRLRRHLARVGKGKPGVFTTQKAIIHPQPSSVLRAALADAELLGTTFDGQQIYLYDYRPDSALLREIGRLREYTFRAVGEGTGQPIDLDRYDRHYRHIVLWNDRQLEIVGAYRLAETGKVAEQHGLSGLYCNELFELSEGFQSLLPAAVELGRSFVQPKYWGKRSLDYLWYGIGAYLKQNPSIRYLYGPVSISNAYPELAKQALVRFYLNYFGPSQPLAGARRAYLLNGGNLDAGFCGSDYQQDFVRLKEYLGYFDVKVPTLYKQYTDLSENGGVVFDTFSVDPNFGYCIDGLVRVDLTKVKQKKLQRYMGL